MSNLLKNSLLFVTLCFLFACGNTPGSNNPADAKGTGQPNQAKSSVKKKTIVFFGNSLTAAYGLDLSEGYVSLIQQRLDSLGLPYRTINAGLSGETTAAGKERVNWVLRQPLDVFVLELGGNDALRGVDPAVTYDNLKAIIEAVKTKYPEVKIILAGMEAPPNMGRTYTTAFRQNYARLADELNLAFIPFFLDGVGGVKELNLPDGIHPNEEGQKILLENVWEVLKPLIAG
jgi:acyl-CoA thioesterase-1